MYTKYCVAVVLSVKALQALFFIIYTNLSSRTIMGVDLHKKVGAWTKYKQNANLGNSYWSYKTPPSSKYRGQSVFKLRTELLLQTLIGMYKQTVHACIV